MVQDGQQNQKSIGNYNNKDDKRQIACQVWFPVGKDPYPISFKFKDDNGEIQSVNDISIHNMEIRCASGFQTNEYRCKAIICGLMREFKIVYHLRTYEWFVLF